MKTTAITVFLSAALFLSGCSSADQKAERGEMPVGNATSPTEAYKMLFSAVKSKDPEKIKTMLSESTMKLAEFQSKQGQKSVDEVIRPGFSGATSSEKLPQIRDEQIKDDFGMIEVYNPKSKMWEMTPFIKENGGWKLAVGDLFNGRWQQPGKTQSQRDMESANTNPPQMAPGANVDWNSIKPMKIDPKNGNVMRGPNPTLGNVKPTRIPTH